MASNVMGLMHLKGVRIIKRGIPRTASVTSEASSSFYCLSSAARHHARQDSSPKTFPHLNIPLSIRVTPFPAPQGELMVITEDYNIYEFPCGDLCASTCLDQAEEQPSYEVIRTLCYLPFWCDIRNAHPLLDSFSRVFASGMPSATEKEHE